MGNISRILHFKDLAFLSRGCHKSITIGGGDNPMGTPKSQNQVPWPPKPDTWDRYKMFCLNDHILLTKKKRGPSNITFWPPKAPPGNPSSPKWVLELLFGVFWCMYNFHNIFGNFCNFFQNSVTPWGPWGGFRGPGGPPQPGTPRRYLPVIILTFCVSGIS